MAYSRTKGSVEKKDWISFASSFTMLHGLNLHHRNYSSNLQRA